MGKPGCGFESPKTKEPQVGLYEIKWNESNQHLEFFQNISPKTRNKPKDIVCPCQEVSLNESEVKIDLPLLDTTEFLPRKGQSNPLHLQTVLTSDTACMGLQDFIWSFEINFW